jgi:hypothetical protein
MRRVTQFSPILNFKDADFKDADSKIAFDAGIFENTRRAIEPLLMFFNLAEQQIDHPDSDVTAGPAFIRRHGAREHFALLLKSREALKSEPIMLFTQRVDQKIISEGSEGYQELRRTWQRLERFAVGVNRHLVQMRLEHEQKQLLAESLKAADGHGIDGFVNQQLGDLYRYGAVLCVPEAIRAIREWPARPTRVFTKRAPIALRLRGPVPPAEPVGVGVDVAVLANDLSNPVNEAAAADAFDRFEKGAWVEHPERLFALAAVMALRLALWDQAATYAQLAAGSAAAESMKDREDREARGDYYELLYLRALTNRFRMGDLRVDAADGEATSRRLLDAALKDLQQCLGYHAGDARAEPHILRSFRAMSERAAVRLFYATWMLRRRQSGHTIGFDPDRTMLEMAEAHKDLHAAADRFDSGMLRAADLDARLQTTHYTVFYNLVRRQVIINSAAWFVFCKLIERDDRTKDLTCQADMKLFTRVRDELRDQISRGPLQEPEPILVDVYAFLWLFDGDRDACAKLASLLLAPEPGLPLDVEMMQLYKTLIPPGIL